jgi:predicted SAM-dependent methyltransferase
MRLNLGCGEYVLSDWENWDADLAVAVRHPSVGHVPVPPIPLDDDSVEEIYCGHLLEHFEPAEADDLLRECRRVLVPGGRLGVVVPDTRRVLEHYLRQDGTVVEVPARVDWHLNDLDAVNAVFLYSTLQKSRHRWSYDRATLCHTLERAGFRLGSSIDPFHDPRHSCGAWWNLGQDAFKPEAPA